SVRRLESHEVMGAGTTLDVKDPTRPVEPALVAGQWEASDGREFKNGDSYIVHARVPTPTEAVLAKATSGNDPRRASSLVVHVGFRPDAHESIPRPPAGGETDEADIQFPPFAQFAQGPKAVYPQFGGEDVGLNALHASYYERTWTLAQRLRAGVKTPYDYVLAVNNYLRSSRFTYTEKPKLASDVPPLEEFLFDTHAGYCQQFSGAMALLLRMGGVPARVAAGFTPGGLRTGSDEWVVRDTDAHSWVEAWFDGIGWVTFDPTPPGTPARSQVAAIAPPTGNQNADTKQKGKGFKPPVRKPDTPRGAGAAATATPGAGHDGGRSVIGWVGLGALALLVAALLAFLVRSARADTPEAALAELEVAMRRTGRSHTPQTTLKQLEQRLGSSSYLQALQAARYGPDQTTPSRAQRAAFRRELARGLGFGRRLRGYYALPPLPPRTLRPRKPS
ncbi:MAG: protein-glutamine gamma-glutamyltransferase, partial [Solirubrobacteraceae bacterium]|nr:protein-glutamine gamma-glutamyltransferase [Solirubrobacteraceae bacterium]